MEENPRQLPQDPRAELEALRAANARLEKALANAHSANEAKNTFLSNMSHDIRTPMNAIVGMTTIALAHIDERDRVLDCLRKIQTASSHLMGLINDVLDMSRIESGKLSLRVEPFSLPDLLHDLAVIVRPQAVQKRQSLRFQVEDIRCETLLGDALRVRQVFVNIVGNAVKYTPEGGNIQVLLRQRTGPAGETVLEFVCRDDGIGMTEEFLTRIFLPFERAANTTMSKVEGTGLGMAICHRLVTQMGGTIQVESAPGKGSCFTVTLPFSAAGEDGAEPVLAGKTVLVVENAGPQAALISRYLFQAGADVQLVDKGVDAVDWLTAALYRAQPPCAILLGEDLGEDAALELAGYLRQLAGPELPILLVSETDWSQIEYRATRAGLSGFIPCPLFRSRLVDAVADLSAKRASVSTDGMLRSDYSGRHFLLVEDNLLNQEIALELLGDTGAEIDTANDGAQAVERFAASPPGYYGLIFMDIQMPVMDGYEATRRIRALDRPDAHTVCIVAMTANVFMEDMQRSREAGMNGHLPKPIDVAKIQSVLQKFLS